MTSESSLNATTVVASGVAPSDRQPYALVTQYGFKDGLRKFIEFDDPVVDLLLLKRVPFFLNSIAEDSRFAQVLEQGSAAERAAALARIHAIPVETQGPEIPCCRS